MTNRSSEEGAKLDPNARTYTSFCGSRLIASSDLRTTLLRTKQCLDAEVTDTVLIFDDQTGNQIDFDFRGSPDDVLARLSSHPLFGSEVPAGAPRMGPGRPKLGVVSREVSLLPRHWDWLEQQPQGISAALRRLVDEARKREPAKEQSRMALEAASRFMWVMAGDLPNFEEASRALFAKDWPRLGELMVDWPTDIREHLSRMVDRSKRFDQATADTTKTGG